MSPWGFGDAWDGPSASATARRPSCDRGGVGNLLLAVSPRELELGRFSPVLGQPLVHGLDYEMVDGHVAFIGHPPQFGVKRLGQTHGRCLARLGEYLRSCHDPKISAR